MKDAGFGLLKPKQEEALKAFVSGKDALPMDYSKSIIYAILPNVYDKLRGMLMYYISITSIWCIEHVGTGNAIIVCISPFTAIMIGQQKIFYREG